MPRGSRASARLGRAVTRILLSIVATIWLLSACSVVLWGIRDTTTAAGAIVVMGAAQYAGRPSPVLRARLDHGIALWKQSKAPVLIFTGGKGAGDTTSEAAVSRRYAMRQGVPDEKILMEGEGRTTTASLQAVAAIMHARHLSSAILVSDPFHMLRLQILARRFGIRAVTSPTRTSPISASRTEALGYVLSESVKVPITIVLAVLGA